MGYKESGFHFGSRFYFFRPVFHYRTISGRGVA